VSVDNSNVPYISKTRRKHFNVLTMEK
jgi:hypothetical protein